MLLQEKKLLITGVLTPHSIAFSVAQMAQKQGAEVLLTSFGRPMSLTQRTAKKLDPVPDVLELDVGNSAHFAALHDTIKQRWGRLDGVLHAIGFAPEDALGGKFMSTPWESVAQAFRISTFSLKELAGAMAPLFDKGGGIVTLDFDNSTQAWPLYDWMGVCKAGLEATVRYLARDLGHRFASTHSQRGPSPPSPPRAYPASNISRTPGTTKPPSGGTHGLKPRSTRWPRWPAC